MQAQLVPHESTDGGVSSSLSSHVHQGAIRFEGFLVGTYDFELRKGHGGDLLIKVEGIVVEPGAENNDLRLAALDISEHFRWVKLRLVDNDGDLPPATQLSISMKGRGTSSFPMRVLRPIMVPTAGIDIEITAVGYQPKVIKKARGDVEVTLVKAWSLDLSVPNLPLLEASELRVTLKRVGEDQPARSRLFQVSKMKIFGATGMKVGDESPNSTA